MMNRWTSQEAEPIGEGTEVLKNLRPTDHFLYFDYKNMRDIFDTDVLNKVVWSGTLTFVRFFCSHTP